MVETEPMLTNMDYVICPSCGVADIKAGSRFCDTCGAGIPMPVVLVKLGCACGGSEFDVDGYCINCGVRQREARDQADSIILGDDFAGMTDVGKRHIRNDDAFDISGPGTGGAGCVMAVCDGVSKSQSPDIASLAASKAARSILAVAIDNGTDARAATRAAITAAHAVACTVPFDRHSDVDPPASTIVTVMVLAAEEEDKLEVVVGWLGDTRLYWLSPNGTGELLTRDHSWCNEVVDEGLMTIEKAQNDERAHSITKCLGTGSYEKPTPCQEPSVATYQIPKQGWLLICTDGLWNYADTPASLILVANGRLWTQPASVICQQFVDYALAQGGMDNITCVLMRLG